MLIVNTHMFNNLQNNNKYNIFENNTTFMSYVILPDMRINITFMIHLSKKVTSRNLLPKWPKIFMVKWNMLIIDIWMVNLKFDIRFKIYCKYS